MPPKKSSKRPSKSQPKKDPRQAKKLSQRAPTINAPQLMTQQQCTEQLKIVTLAVLSKIAFIRNFFPAIKEQYTTRVYDPADAKTTYDDFVQSPHEPQENLVLWKILPQHQNKGADRIYEYLEGLKDAIDKGYLHSFHLTIHAKGQGPLVHNDILESYIMTYGHGNDAVLQLSGTPKGGHKEELLVTARGALYDFVQDIHKSLSVEHKKFAPLQGGCRLGLSIVYNDHCPNDYEAPMFRAGVSETRKMIETTLVNGKLNVDLKSHSLSMGWSQHQRDKSPISVTDSNVLSNDERQVSEPITTEEPYQDSTQGTAVNRYQAMGQTRTSRQVVRDTQLLSQKETLPSLSPIHKLIYNEEVLNEIERARLADKETPRDVVLSCYCTSDLEKDLINCDVCFSLQHLPCYGYLDSSPTSHVCYDCLANVLPISQATKNKLRTRTLVRRVIFHLSRLDDSQFWINSLEAFLGSPKIGVTSILDWCTKDCNLVIDYDGGAKRPQRTGQLAYSLEHVDMAAIFDPTWEIKGFFQQAGSAPSGLVQPALSPHQSPQRKSRSQLRNMVTTPVKKPTLYDISNPNDLMKDAADSYTMTTASVDCSPLSDRNSLSRYLKRRAIDETPDCGVKKAKRTAFRSPFEL